MTLLNILHHSLSRLPLVLLLSAGSALLCCCSVKEDRSLCPVHLTVYPGEGMPDLPEGGEFDFRSTLDGWKSARAVFTAEQFRQGYSVVMKPGEVVLSGVYGWPWEGRNDEYFTVPVGVECPDAFAFRDRFDMPDSDLVRPQCLRSLYARLFLIEKHPGSTTGDIFSVQVRGGCDGFYVPSLAVHHGPYSCVPRRTGPDRLETRLPRQDGRDLEIVFRQKAPGSQEAFDVYSLDLGAILQDHEYDWTSGLLEDIYIEIDYMHSALVIRVGDWVVVRMMDGKYRI